MNVNEALHWADQDAAVPAEAAAVLPAEVRRLQTRDLSMTLLHCQPAAIDLIAERVWQDRRAVPTGDGPARVDYSIATNIVRELERYGFVIQRAEGWS